MEEGADQLLSRAEKLLIEVTSCIKPAAVAKKFPDPNIIRDLLLNAHDFSTPKPDTESDLTQIEWLIRGLPEAYESEPTFDDEAVQAILKEGGNPPTQLTLPSVYAANQRVLEKLSAAKMIRIRLCHLLVFSTRYGVRKEGSYFLVYPPSGCQRPTATATQSIMLPLKEIEENGHILAQLMRRNEKRDSIRNYFVGSVDLEKVVDLELLLSDAIIREWINGAPSGTIRIELHGFINSPNTVVRGEKAEAMRLAHAVVPLGGLLGTASLDAMVHCDLDVDDSSHSLIATRMNNISFGQRVAKQKALGPKLGTLTVRISMLDEQQVLALANKGKHHGHHHAGHLLDHEVAKLLIPVVHKGDRVVASQLSENALGEQFNKVHGALDYVPSEHIPDNNKERIAEPHQRSSATDAPTRPVYGSGKDVSGVFGLALCAVESLKLPIEHVLLLKEIGTEAQPTLLVTYKTSAKERERILLPVRSLEKAEINLDAGQAHMYSANITQWVAPIVEVWLTWKATARSSEEKLLLGLARYPPGYKIGTLARLPIVDSARSLTRGFVVTAAVLGQEEHQVETSLQCLLNFYSLENGGLRANGDVHAMRGSAAASTHGESAHTPAQKPDPPHNSHAASEHDSMEETKTDSPQHVTELSAGPEHDGAAEEADDSIGDICFLLNGPHDEDRVPEADHSLLLEREPAAVESASRLRSSVESFLALETAAIQAESPPTVAASPPRSGDEHGSSEGAIESKDQDNFDEEMHHDLTQAQSNHPQHASTTSLHLLDFALDGVFDALLPVSTQGSGQDIFGCFVCYSLPSQAQDGSPGHTEYTLWWDGECALLNGSHRHKFEIAHLDTESLERAFDSSKVLQFVLLASDTDGNLPANPVKLGEAFLPLAELCDMMVRQSGYQVLSLPLIANEQDKRFRSTHRLSSTSAREVRLSVSHRVEPVLLRKSLEFNQSAVSDAEPTTVAAAAPAPVPAPAHAHAGPTDAVSRLLGFDITQEDLDDILYFRTSASPEPWVPFALGDPNAAGATSIVDVMLGAASASSAAAQPLVAAVADHVFARRDWGSYAGAVEPRSTEAEPTHCLGDGYAALKQSLLELECINKLYNRSEGPPAYPSAVDETRVHELSQNQSAMSSEESEEGIIESDVDSEEYEEKEDNSTELYRSDFESITIDDAVLQDDFSDSEDSDSEDSFRNDNDSAISHTHRAELSAAPQPSEQAQLADLAADPPMQDVVDGHEQHEVSTGSSIEAPADEDEEWIVVNPHDSEPISEDLQFEPTPPVSAPAPAPAHPVLLNDRESSVPDVLQREDDEHSKQDDLSDGAESVESESICQDTTEMSAELNQSTSGAGLDESEMEADQRSDGSSHCDEDAAGHDQEAEMSVQIAESRHLNEVEDAPASVSPTASLQGHPSRETSAMGMEESIEDMQTIHSLREVSLCGSLDGALQVSLTGYVTAGGHLLVSTSFDSTRGLSLNATSNKAEAVLADVSSYNAGALRAGSTQQADSVGPADSSMMSMSRSVHTTHGENDNDASGLHSADISASHADVSVDGHEDVASAKDGAAAETEEDEKEDSPNTSKIKNIVDSEISRIFGPDVSLHPARELLAQQDKRLAGADQVHQTSQPDIADQLGVQYWWNKIETKQPVATVAASGAAPSAQRAQSEMEALRESLQRVQAAMPKDVVPQRRRAGQQRKFIDAETDRVSNIMMGVFRKSAL